MPKPSLRQTIEFQAGTIKNLERQLAHLGECLAQSTCLVQTQDGEIQRLTTLNDKIFEIINRLTGPNYAQPKDASV